MDAVEARETLRLCRLNLPMGGPDFAKLGQSSQADAPTPQVRTQLRPGIVRPGLRYLHIVTGIAGTSFSRRTDCRHAHTSSSGSESLLVHCGSALLDAGHSVAAVVSETPEIVAWAESRHLRSLGTVGELAEAVDLRYDFVLSIGNLHIVPAAVLHRATFGGINFHDGPLPELGGLNTPAWAILRGNREHGVTWHWMTETVDAGSIIIAPRFRIAEDETALTLNARCFDSAIECFPAVLAALRLDHPTTNQQGPPPRELISGKRRPAAAGALDWRRPAAELSALVRALDFGQYANPLCLPKASHRRHPTRGAPAAGAGAVVGSRPRNPAGGGG